MDIQKKIYKAIRNRGFLISIQKRFYKAIENNDINNVKLLLNDKRVDPSDNNNWAIKLLLKDKRVNPSLKEDYFELYEILIEKDKIQNKIKDFLLIYLL